MTTISKSPSHEASQVYPQSTKTVIHGRLTDLSLAKTNKTKIIGKLEEKNVN